MLVDLSEQYNFIIDRYKENKVEIPIAAFLENFETTCQKKDYPIALINRQINLDQLLAIYNAISIL